LRYVRHRRIGIPEYARHKLLLKGAGANAHGALSVAERVPRQADSWSKIVLVRNKERLTKRWSAVEDSLHTCCPPIALAGRCHEFMPKSDSDGQSWTQLDVVLDKPTEQVLLVTEL